MQEDLQYLLELSAVDKRSNELKLTKKDLPVRIQTLKDDIEREKTNAEKTSAAITETKAQIAQNQDMAVVEQAALTESNHRLEAISTNREYDAVHLESPPISATSTMPRPTSSISSRFSRTC